MFVQSSHFIEAKGEDTSHKVTFYGQEKTGTTVRLAKMNLAVHGLEGDIREANSYYQDEHELVEKCDFVMANPPFNVDAIDAEKIKTDRRLPFGLPGVNKAKKVSNGNYVWISYFHAYLKEKGRAGFVMSSQASSAGNQEAEVRRKLVETGDVDLMISIRSNFFYTRSVPCELWFLDKGKPEAQRDTVLMIDARNIYRKVTRKIYDFTPEHLNNLNSIVCLYRGQTERFVKLVQDYFGSVCEHAATVPEALEGFTAAFGKALEPLKGYAASVMKAKGLPEEKVLALEAALTETLDAEKAFVADEKATLAAVDAWRSKFCKNLPANNKNQHAARAELDPVAAQIKGLSKQVDLLSKLLARVAQACREVAAEEYAPDGFERNATTKLIKAVDKAKQTASEALKQTTYFHRQIVWLQERFPEAKFCAVAGLCNAVTRAEIEAADWSLTPGRYVGVAPAEEDENFDFEQTIRDIHSELADLNEEAATLAAKIQENFEGLAV
jgi:type I restriction enzyme M protein